MQKILVIEDSLLMQDYMERRLEKAGFFVETWQPHSAMEIPKKIQELLPDLVITDYQMPDCNGATVIRMVTKENPGIPILVLTAFRDEDLEHELTRLGAKQVLFKPLEGDELISIIKKTLSEASENKD